MFDPKSYSAAVLKPLNRDTAQQEALKQTLRLINEAKDRSALMSALVNCDMAAIFGVTQSMSDSELAAYLQSLKMYLNKGVPPVATSVGQVLTAATNKAQSFGSNIATAKFWAEIETAASQANQNRLQEFAAAVKQSWPLAVATAEQLRKAASSQGLPASISDKELASAVGAQGVQVCPDFEVPKVSASAPTLKKYLNQAFRSIIDVVMMYDGNKPTDIAVVEELSASFGSSRRKIGLADVQKSTQEANKRSDKPAEDAKKTLQTIELQCKTDADLRALALAWFALLADESTRVMGLLPPQALGRLKDAGLADLDARRILSKAGSTSAGPDVNNVKDMVASGDLQSARRLLVALSGDLSGEPSPQFKEATAALETAEAQKQKSMDAYRKAMQSQDYALAQQALSAAQAMDREDPDIPRLLEQLPPAAPTGLQAVYSPAEGGVHLSWRGAQSSDIRYAVARSESGVPANPKAGIQVTAGTTNQSVVDANPAVAVKSTYAVFAFRQAGGYSPPATVQITVLPAPGQVSTAIGTADVTVFWKVPSQASGVTAELIKPDGTKRAFPPISQDRLLIDGLILGQKYTIALTARYIVGGQPTNSPTVTVDATPRGMARAVEDLRLSGSALPGGKPGLCAQWTQIPGYTVDLWSMSLGTSARAGNRATSAQLEQLGGVRVVGSMKSAGSLQTLDFEAPAGVRALFPITWDGTNGIIGTPVTAGSAPPPTNVTAERYGSEVVVSWYWPNGDFMMDVEWSRQGVPAGRMRVDPLSYKRDGGAHIQYADQVTEVSVATVATGGGQEYACAPVVVRLSASAPTLSYVLKLPRSPFGRDAEATITSSGYNGSADIVAVLSASNYMPASADMGQQIARFSVNFGSGANQQVTFAVPKIKGHFWVRLFPAIADQFVMTDPPTSSMKG